MGMIGRWIDHTCKREPQVMRRVLNRAWGPLASLYTDDGKCGCLIGSYNLEGGVQEWPERIDMLVWELTTYPRGGGPWPTKRPDASVIRLLKQRIRKSLGIAPVNRPVLETVTP